MPFELLEFILIKILSCEKTVDILRSNAFFNDLGIPADLEGSSDNISRLIFLDIDDNSDLVSRFFGKSGDIINNLLRIVSLDNERYVDMPNKAID